MISENCVEEGGGDADFLTIQFCIVFHRVLSRDAGEVVCPTDFVEGAIAANQLS